MTNQTKVSAKKSSLALVIIIALLMMMVNPIFAAETAEARPTASANVSSVVDVENAYNDSSNFTFAKWNNSTDTADFTNFNIAIPAGDVIDEVKVILTGYRLFDRQLLVSVSADGTNFSTAQQSDFWNTFNLPDTDTMTFATPAPAWNSDSFNLNTFKIRIGATVSQHSTFLRGMVNSDYDVTLLGNISVIVKHHTPPVTVTFDKNGGDTDATPTSATTTLGSTVALPVAPTLTGYHLGSWNTQANGGGTEFNASTPVTANMTVFAQWLPNTDTTYTVKHFTEKLDGTWKLMLKENLTGTTGTFATAVLQSYPGFTAPTPAPSKKINANGNMNIRVEYTRDLYLVSFDSDGGSAVDPITEPYLSAVTAPANPTRAGYIFAEWSPAIPATMPLGGAALTARWFVDKTVTKVWSDDEDLTGLRPESIEVQLYQNKAAYGEPVTLSAGNSWKHDFSELPEKDGDGLTYTYTVLENVSVAGYMTSYNQSNLTITNTVQKYPIQIIKLDGRDGETRLPGAIFELYDANLPLITPSFVISEEPIDPPAPLEVLTTDENGQATTSGVYAPGSYYLIETKAPTGFYPIPFPISVEMPIDAERDGAYVVSIINEFIDVPSLSIDKKAANITRGFPAASLSEFYVGETAQYSLTVVNDGNCPLVDVIVTDNKAVVGDPVKNVTSRETVYWAAGIGGIATLNLGVMGVNDIINLTYDHVVTAVDLANTPIINEAVVTGRLRSVINDVNVARIAGPEFDPDLGTTVSDKSSATITVTDIPLNMSGITIDKKAQNVTQSGTPSDLATGYAGDIFRYTITIKNTGSLDLANIILTDNKALVGGTVTNVTAGNTAVWQPGTGGIATLTISSLGAGKTVVLTYDYTTTSADIGIVRTNTAAVNASIGITLDDPKVIKLSKEDSASISVDAIPLATATSATTPATTSTTNIPNIPIPTTGETSPTGLFGLFLLICATALFIFRKRLFGNEIIN